MSISARSGRRSSASTTNTITSPRIYCEQDHVVKDQKVGSRRVHVERARLGGITHRDPHNAERIEAQRAKLAEAVREEREHKAKREYEDRRRKIAKELPNSTAETIDRLTQLSLECVLDPFDDLFAKRDEK